jgi:hypothetical protein
VLLLLLGANTRLARYAFHQRTLKLATTQAYLDGSETLRTLPKAVPLMLWQVAVIAAFAIVMLHARLLADFLPWPVPVRETDPDCYLRPPPIAQFLRPSFSCCTTMSGSPAG